MNWSEVKKINSNLGKPLDTLITEKADEVKTATASQTSINTVTTAIGATNNTDGTATAGSIFAKLNKLLTDWTTARAGKIDNLDAAISTRASQASITTLQNTVNNVNGNVVAPAMIMKNPRTIHLGASVNQSEFTVNLPLNVRVVRLYSEYSGSFGGVANNYSSNRSCIINGVALSLYFNDAINSPQTSSNIATIDKIFTASTSFPFRGSYTTATPYNVYALICDI